ncbi:hypothetical protein G6F25_011708 [Rhizopus arrhizus]|nr:hypothetical protein G6F25_011708 [Rhizopus arrhizus]
MQLISIYEEALKLQHKGKLEEAKEKYEQLIDHKFLKKEAKARKNTKEDDKDDNSSPLLTLFFVVSKNYASVLEEEYNRNQDIDSAREALKYYLQAIEMDPTAYSIWYHVGCLSHSLKNLRFARLAYENGIFTNEETRKKSVLDVIRSGRFTPIQWNCFEGLCKVLCDIGDYFTCQHYIENTLKEQSEWTLGKILLERMKEDPMTDLMDVDEQATSIEPVEITIEKSDLSMLMEKLLALYRKQHTANNLEDEIAEESLESNIEINNTMFINNAVKISIEKDEVPVVEAVQEEPHPQPSSEVLLPSSNIMPFTMIDHQISTEGETLAQDESEKSQKRKREDVVDAVTGEDEESDQEDTKKANLRASRRKKEKFLNTEASRMKMLQEEKQFDLKIQEFYDSLNTIPNLYKNRPWHEPQQASIIVPPHFWDWFDIKINELESTYSWDMDGKRSDLDSLEHNSKGKGLTMFAMNYSINSTNDQTSSNLTKKIISNLNADNSGVVDVLCKLVITTVKEDMYLDKETSFMSNNLLELLTDTINSLEANFINHLAYLNTHEKALATLRVCEYFIDRLIRAIMIATQEAGSHIGFSASYKKKASNMLSKQSKVKQIESLMETAKLWTNLAERHLFDISSTLFESNKNNPEASATLSQDEQKFQLRYYNILGKLAQCQDDIQNASRYYEKCKSILELNPSLKEINIKSMYDSFIDLKSMYNKLSLLRIGNLLVQAKDKSDVGDFPTVIEVIKPIVESKLNTGDPIESDETIQMIVLLAKAYTRAEQHTEAWNCYKQIFCSLVKQMVEYGSSQFQSKSILCKDEDVIFSKIGKHLGDVMDDLLTLIEDPESEKWLPKEADKDFIDILTIVLRMTVYYIFRHPDFVPLVNNFSSPDSIPHTPSRITKANRFNAIVIKSWIIHSHLIKRELRAQTRKTQKIMFDWVKLLQEFHDELGEREICCTSNGMWKRWI